VNIGRVPRYAAAAKARPKKAGCSVLSSVVYWLMRSHYHLSGEACSRNKDYRAEQ
jgi:hypothetical protein